MNGKGKTVCAFSPADYRAAVVEMRPEKHYIPVIGYRVGDVIPGKDGISFISFYKWDFVFHSLPSPHY
jgi:hypothetical protein